MNKCKDDSLYYLIENKGESACGDLIWDNSTCLIGLGSNDSIHLKPLRQCLAHSKHDVNENLKNGNSPSKFMRKGGVLTFLGEQISSLLQQIFTEPA